MKRYPILLALLTAVILVTGCVSKSELDAVQAELASCQQEKVEAEASTIAWEQRFDRESNRWQQIESSVSEAVPNALVEFHEERKKILEMVPEQVKKDIETYLQDYFNTVMRGFERLQDANSDINLKLEATYKALEAVGADTRSIGTTIDETLAGERSKRQKLETRISDVVDKAISDLVTFDQTQINCKDCPDRLRLNRKERETILAFHTELIQSLTVALRASEGGPEPTVAPSDGADASEEGDEGQAG